MLQKHEMLKWNSSKKPNGYFFFNKLSQLGTEKGPPWGSAFLETLWWVLKVDGPIMIFEIFFGPEVSFENYLKIRF